MIFFLVIFFNYFVPNHFLSINWGYRILNDDHDIFLPNKWHKINPNCLGESQSPININFEQTEHDKNLTSFEIITNDKLSNETWSIKNTGYTRKTIFNNNSFIIFQSSAIFLKVLMETDKNFEFWANKELFSLKQLHFHWCGSEHFIDNQEFAGEMHLVFHSLNNTQNHSVIGFILQVNKLSFF